MTMRHLVSPVIVPLILWLAAGAGCGGRAEQKAEAAAKAAEKPITVSVAEAVLAQVDRRVDITGTLAAWEEGTVSIEADGRLVHVAVDLGDRVARGQTLARIAPEEYEWRRAQAEAEHIAAESDLRRVQELFAKKLAPQQQIDEGKRRLDTSRAALDLARKKLNDCVLRAPFDGAIARRMINNGEYVRTGSPAFQVVRLNPLKFRGDVPERYTADVKKGDQLLAYVESDTGEPLKGTIVRIGPAVDLGNRSFPIEAEFPNKGGAVKPGTFARVSILTTTLSDAIVVPETALTSFAGNPRVYVVDGARVKERVVEPGEKTKDRVVIRKGLSAGEKVVVTGVELLQDGKAVTIR
jgi:membrane fusion protein (multidrug efflux system)